ncbi:MAG: hypothetical protein D6785_00075 [Planctomycetota bacterium]|nr:MAG: hypothetical protein D6785_00075 [Planctomycetota bacterium]
MIAPSNECWKKQHFLNQVSFFNISIFLVLSALFFSASCTTTPDPPPKITKKNVGILCKSQFEPNLKKIQDFLQKKNKEKLISKKKKELLQWLNEILKGSLEAPSKYKPKMEDENLENYYSMAKRLESKAKAAKEALEKDKMERFQKEVKKIQLSCTLCHGIYRP